MSDNFDQGITPTQQALMQIWCSVFKVGKVSVMDNFFDLGGDSLIAHQIRLRIREDLRVEVPLSLLFEEPGDISTLSRAIDEIG